MIIKVDFKVNEVGTWMLDCPLRMSGNHRNCKATMDVDCCPSPDGQNSLPEHCPMRINDIIIRPESRLLYEKFRITAPGKYLMRNGVQAIIVRSAASSPVNEVWWEGEMPSYDCNRLNVEYKWREDGLLEPPRRSPCDIVDIWKE